MNTIELRLSIIYDALNDNINANITTYYLLFIEVEEGIDIYGSVESGARDWSINVNIPQDWGE